MEIQKTGDPEKYTKSSIHKCLFDPCERIPRKSFAYPKFLPLWRLWRHLPSSSLFWHRKQAGRRRSLQKANSALFTQIPTQAEVYMDAASIGAWIPSWKLSLEDQVVLALGRRWPKRTKKKPLHCWENITLQVYGWRCWKLLWHPFYGLPLRIS